MKKKKKYYVDNTRFEEIIKKYLSKNGKKKNEEELTHLLDLMISGILHGMNFNIDKEDARQECLLLVFKTLKKFKPGKGKAFNYFSTIIINNLKFLYTKDKKEKDRYKKYLEDLHHTVEPIT
jgi:DNA-directed RNA polymerase specialized sigma24 family protein